MYKKYYLIILLILITIISTNAKANFIINSSLSQEFIVDNKKRVSGEVKIKNVSGQPIKIRLYKRDYIFDAAGKNYYQSPGQHKRSNADWIKLNKNSFSLSPYKQKTIRYVIEVPNSIIKKGTYWSMLMVEEFQSNTERKSWKQRGLQQNIRYGIQVITDFAHNKDITLSFKNPSLKEIKKGGYIFKTDLYNRGDSYLPARIKILLVNNKTGEIKNEESKNTKRIYPGTAIRIKERFKLKTKEDHKLIILAGNNEDGYFGKKYLIRTDKD